MRTANITYYGEGPLNLQLRRFKAGKSVKARLDDILPDERRRYADRFLVVGADGVIINIGSMVPTEVAKIVIGVNPRVYKVPGFDVCIPPGYALDDTGADPQVVEASVMAAKMTAVAVEEDPGPPPNLTIVKDDPEDDDLKPGETFEIGDTKVEVETVDPEKGEATLVVTPPVPAEEVEVTVGIPSPDTVGETIPVEESGPSLNDSEEEPPAPKPAAKKKKKPAKKKSRADSLLEEF